MKEAATKFLAGSGLGGATVVPDLAMPECLRYVVWFLLVYLYLLLPAFTKTYEAREVRRRFHADDNG